MKVAIITGWSSWLWRRFIPPIYRTSVDQIWVLGRNKTRLKEIREEYWERVIPYVIDLSNKDEIDRFLLSLKASWAEIQFLVNNAWFWIFWTFEWAPIEDSLKMIDVNARAMVQLTHGCLPYMARKSNIINVSSMASFQPVPYLGVYAATKAFIKNYSRALAIELKDRYITVTTVMPWWMNTPFMQRADIWAKKTPKKYPHMANPEFVAEKALRDSMKWREVSIYWWYPKAIRLCYSILPDKLVMKYWIKQQDL